MMFAAGGDLRSDGISRKRILKITITAVAASALPKTIMTLYDGQLPNQGVALSRENKTVTFTA
jgi:hypothetical protein